MSAWPRLMLLVGVGVGFILVFAVSSYYGRRSERMLELVRSGHFPSVQTGDELAMLLTQMQRGLLDAAGSSDPAALLQSDQSYKSFLSTLDRAASNPIADGQSLEELRRAVDLYYLLARRTTERMIAGEPFSAITPSLAVMKERQNEAQRLLEERRRRDDAAIRAAFDESRSIQRTTMTVMGAGILSCLAALLVGSLLSDRLQETRRRNEWLQQNHEALEREVAHRTEELTATTHALAVAKNAAERAAEKNAELSRRNRMILDSVGEGIFGLDGHGAVTFINPAAARMLGWTTDEILGRNLHDVLHGSHTPEAGSGSCALCEALRTAGASEGTDFMTRAGAAFPVEYTSNEIVEGDGVANGVVVIFRDISARRAIETMKDEFISTVNHELRTPLTSIRGALGLLGSGLIGSVGPRGERMLTIATQNTDRLIRLINDILDLERIRSGKMDIERKPIAVNELMRIVVDGVQTLADNAQVKLEIEPAAAIVLADADQMVQTLTNLVSNAIKFSPVGTAVTIGGTEVEDEFRFHVSDRGRGIPEDRLESIFERFQQVDASDSRAKGGSGLGLAICRSIVNAHGGRIWAERREGGGSTFQFTLPLVARPHLDEIPSQRTLLVGTEDRVWAGQIVEMLKSGGFRVVTVSRPNEVAEVAAQTRPDSIVLDVVSNEGWRIVESLQADPETRSIPVVVVGAEEPETIERYAAKIAGWVAKPLRREELVEVVNVACAMPAIVVVEDDLDLARVMTAALRMHGIRTIHAATGKEAVALCRDHQPNLLVLDLILPDMDGYAVVEALRNEPSLDNIPVVVYSALEVMRADQPRLRLGQTEFLTKSRTTLQEFQSHVIRLLNEVTTPSRRGDAAA